MRITEKVIDIVEVRLVGKRDTVLSTFFLAAERRTYEGGEVLAEWVMPERITWTYTASEPVAPQYLEYRASSLNISWLRRPWVHRTTIDRDTMSPGDILTIVLPTSVLKLG